METLSLRTDEIRQIGSIKNQLTVQYRKHIRWILLALDLGSGVPLVKLKRDLPGHVAEVHVTVVEMKNHLQHALRLDVLSIQGGSSILQ